MQKKRRWLFFLLALLLCGCGFGPTAKEADSEKTDGNTGFEVTSVDSYDSMDVATVESIDLTEKTITLINTAVSKTYTLTFDGTTRFYDKNMQSLAAMQIHGGDVVEVTFLKSKKTLNTLQLYPGSWIMEGVSSFQIAQSGKVVEIYGEKYCFTDNSIVLIPGGKGELMDINVTDTITVTGMDHDICSITVTKGHGYLRLANDAMVIGGWIEVGNGIIRPITEDMLLLVPEGEYQVSVSVGNASLKNKVAIKRDQETVFDCSSFEPEEIKYGSILFTVEPENTNVYIDGTKVDLSAPVELTYGIHQMIARAAGYETLSKYIKVGSEYATLAVLLEEVAEETQESAEESGSKETDKTETGETESVGTESESESEPESESESTAQETDTESEETKESDKEESASTQNNDSSAIDTTASTTYRVYVDAPSGVEVYFDGTYVGLSPTNFKKVAGSHTITLRKSGFVTRSYTIQIDEEQKDISYSFSELESLSEQGD